MWENAVWLEVSGITLIEKYMDKLWGSYGMFLPQRRLRQVLHFVLWMEVCTTLFYISWPPYSPQLTIREPYILYMYWYDDEDPSYSRLALMWFIWENGVIWLPFYPFEHMCDLLYTKNNRGIDTNLSDLGTTFWSNTRKSSQSAEIFQLDEVAAAITPELAI